MSHIPNERWFCVNCKTTGDLSRQGRCATCGSDSVVSLDAQHLNPLENCAGGAAREVEELEHMVGVRRRP